MRRLALVAYIAVLVLFAILIARPYLRVQHDTPTEVPSPSPLAFTSLDVLPAGHRLCMGNVAMTRQSEQVRFRAGSYGKPGPPLALTVRGARYSATRRVKGGWADNAIQQVALPRPAHDQLVTVCILNDGRTTIALYAAGDNAQSRVLVTMDGKQIGPTPELAFFENHTRSIAQNASLTAARIGVFRGFLGHTWIVWALAALFVVGVPLLLGTALAMSARP